MRTVSLNSALRSADSVELANRSVCEEIRKPTVPKPQAKAFTDNELGTTFEAARESQWEAFVQNAFATAAQRGELVALRWSDYRFAEGDRKAATPGFTKLCEQIGASSARFHALRHSAESTMLTDGVDLVTVSRHRSTGQC
jgi:integrase